MKGVLHLLTKSEQEVFREISVPILPRNTDLFTEFFFQVTTSFFVLCPGGSSFRSLFVSSDSIISSGQIY